MNADDISEREQRRSPASMIVAAAVAAIAGFVAVYVSLGGIDNLAPVKVSAPVAPTSPDKAAPSGSGPLVGLSKGKVAAFVARSEPQPVPAFSFHGADGKELSLRQWQGKVVLLNLWASWCAPCREEMPSLDRLEAALGGEDFDVLAIANDRGGSEKPRNFLNEIGVQHLAFYQEPSGKLPITLKAIGMPTTLLIGRDGKEIGRLVGPAEWDSPEAIALIKAAIAERRD